MKILKKVIIILIFIICIIIFIQANKVLGISDNADTLTQNKELTYKRQENGEILISGFKIGEKVSDVLERKLVDGYIIKIKNNKEIDITNNPDIKIGTGNKIELYLPNQEMPEKTYTIVIYGDTNGDSNVEAVDALAIIKNKIGTDTFQNKVLEEAGRIQNETRENSTIPKAADALSLIKYKLYPEEYMIDQKLKQSDKEIITVELNANGGILEKSTKNIIYKCTYGELPIPTRQGYKFIGWFTQENEGTKIESTTTVEIIEDHTIYAHWEKSSYMLTVNHYLENADDENYKLSTTTTYSVLYDTELTLESLKTVIENGTYKYASLSENGTETINYKIKADTTIYIYYSRNTYTVTLEAGNNITSVTGEGKCKIGASKSINAIFPSGYFFSQWEIKSGTGKIENLKSASTIVIPTSNITLKAVALEAIAQIGTKQYDSIQSAINMANNTAQTTVKVLKSHNISYDISNNANIVLDLAGNTLTISKKSIIKNLNKGILEIKNGTINLNNDVYIHNNNILILSSKLAISSNSENEVVRNYGDLVLNGADIQWNPNTTSPAFGAIVNHGNFTMNSGNITAFGIYNFCLDNRNGGKSYIYNGILDGRNLNTETIVNNSEGIIIIGKNETSPNIYGPINYDLSGNNYAIENKGTITIVNGNIYGFSNTAIFNYKGTLNINGGTILNDSELATIEIRGTGTINITAGTIKNFGKGYDISNRGGIINKTGGTQVNIDRW